MTQHLGTLTADAGGTFRIFQAYADTDSGVITGYARGYRTNCLVRFTQTGMVVNQGQVRCRITDLVDNGTDVLADGESFGGKFNPTGM